MFTQRFILYLLFYFIKHKSEIFSIFKQCKAQVKNRTRRKVKNFRSDNGLEYKDSEFLEFCKIEGIIGHFTIKGTP